MLDATPSGIDRHVMVAEAPRACEASDRKTTNEMAPQNSCRGRRAKDRGQRANPSLLPLPVVLHHRRVCVYKVFCGRLFPRVCNALRTWCGTKGEESGGERGPASLAFIDGVMKKKKKRKRKRKQKVKSCVRKSRNFFMLGRGFAKLVWDPSLESEFIVVCCVIFDIRTFFMYKQALPSVCLCSPIRGCDPAPRVSGYKHLVAFIP